MFEGNVKATVILLKYSFMILKLQMHFQVSTGKNKDVLKFSQSNPSFQTMISLVISRFRDLNWDQVFYTKERNDRCKDVPCSYVGF